MRPVVDAYLESELQIERRYRRIIIAITIVCSLVGSIVWFYPGLERNTSQMVGGTLLKVSLVSGLLWLAWPQFKTLIHWRLGLAGVVLLCVAILALLIRPKMLLVLGPVIVSLAGTLGTLGWLVRYYRSLSQDTMVRKSKGRSAGQTVEGTVVKSKATEEDLKDQRG